MNNTRRKAITAIMEQLENLRSEIETLHDQEQEAFDNLPRACKAANAAKPWKRLPITWRPPWTPSRKP